MGLNLALRLGVAAWLLMLPETCFAWREDRHHSDLGSGHSRWDRHRSDFDRSDPSQGWGTFKCRSSECFSKHPQGHWSHPLTAPRVRW